MNVNEVRALLFDVFGTLVDWRGGVARELAAFGRERGLEADWTAFADAWRAAYVPSMQRVRSGELPWTNLDELQTRSFAELAPRFGLPELDAREVARCVSAWHRLDPWPDVPAGLARLRRGYVLGTLSNGNLSLLIDLARHGDLRFDAILSSEVFRHYKPDPETYLGAAALLGLAPHQVMLVAAHVGDLRAAATQGLRTAFVVRPYEFGSPEKADPAPRGEVDFSVTDLDELADELARHHAASRT
ncbi:MAG: haloacid dehalogenase type II [Vulcanimicrobiaceae bacterium]